MLFFAEVLKPWFSTSNYGEYWHVTPPLLAALTSIAGPLPWRVCASRRLLAGDSLKWRDGTKRDW